MSGSDVVVFGNLVRAKRNQIGISQEAVAAAVFGNPDRKSFVSAIENARRPNLTWQTTQQLAASLGIARDEVPPSLQWPQTEKPMTSDSSDGAAIARALSAQLEHRLSRTLSDVYAQSLRIGLRRLRHWTGGPFSLRSFWVSYCVALLYVAIAGVIGLAADAPPVGGVAAFSTQGIWPPGMAALMTLAVLIGCGWTAFLLVKSARTGKLTVRVLRVATGALICGIGCAAAGLLGADALAVAPLMALAAFAALASWTPRAAILAGLLGGLMAGISAGIVDEKGPLLGALEGAIFGASVGAAAGYMSAWTGQRAPSRAAGMLSGAGAGIASGIVLIIIVLMALQQSSALDRQSEGILILMWVALPLANAISDYLSLGVSHWLAIKAARTRQAIIGYLVLLLCDLVLAVCLLVLTLIFIRVGLNVADQLFASDLSPDAFLRRSAADPWGAGVWLTLMVISTLTWTYLHYALVVVPALVASCSLIFLEMPMLQRAKAMAHNGTVDFGLMALVPIRRLIFYSGWAGLSLLPLIILLNATSFIPYMLSILRVD